MSYYTAGDYYRAGGFWKRLGRVVGAVGGSLISAAAGAIPGGGAALSAAKTVQAAWRGGGGAVANAVRESQAGTPGHVAARGRRRFGFRLRRRRR